MASFATNLSAENSSSTNFVGKRSHADSFSNQAGEDSFEQVAPRRSRREQKLINKEIE